MKTINDIQERFTTFPENYVNDINGWGFSKSVITTNKGQLLTLDIDFGDVCSLNCPSCFRKNNSIDNSRHALGFENMVDLIREAKTLGLRTVKFLGAGEPFENRGVLKFLRFLKDEAIVPLLFTKGHVIGNDELVKKYFGDIGITTGEKLVEAVYECDASVMLGFNSFNSQLQAQLVGSDISYVSVRDRALMLFEQHGFANSNPTRLALAANPVTKRNINEAFDIYKWGRLRNYYVIVTPTMISGRAKRNDRWKTINVNHEELINLYTKIYSFNIEQGIQTLSQIKREGISAYAGGHPCNQVSTGLYITLNGTVLSCPGTDKDIEGNVWESSLTDIWKKSNNYKRSGIFNCKCIAKDGKSIPVRLYDEVLKRLED